MYPLALHSQITPHLSLSPLQTHQRTIIRVTKRAHFVQPALPCFTRWKCCQSPVFKVVRSSMVEDRTIQDKVLDAEDAALLVHSCITRNLPPVLSLEQGLDRIREAVEELKAKPPSCSSGIYRFQLAVPPSAKALNWYCSQLESSNVFPLFFLSNEKENTTCKSLPLRKTRGGFGIGSAVNFQGRSHHDSAKPNDFLRCLPAEPTSSKAYGFLDIEVDTKTSTIKHEKGSFYLFIPQIELDEFEDISFLIGTLAWDDSSIRTFSEAIQSFEFSFDQARSCCNGNKGIHSSLSKFNNVEEHTKMVRINSLLLDGRHLETSILELVSP